MRTFELDSKLAALAATVDEELPEAIYGITGVEEIFVPMRDGVALHTHVYFPDQGDCWPFILIRNPYPHNHALIETFYSRFVLHGYGVIIQSCRGTGQSEGQWEPFMNEREDGLDTLDWLISQPYQDGNIALFGQSYSSFTTWVMADAFPPEVKTVFLDLFGIDRYGQMYMNGMFRHDIYTSWAFGNSGVLTDKDPGKLYQQALHILPHNQADQKLFGQTLPFYQQYISETSRVSDYWQNGVWADLLNMPAKINIPVFMVEGWFDHHLEGSLKGYELLSPEIRQKSRLVIGPWDHAGNSPGELNYPDANLLGTARIKAGLEWFDIHLKDNPNHPSPVSYYRIGTGKWVHTEHFVSGPSTRLYLSGNKTCGRDGSLRTQRSEPSTLSYDYDPSTPIATYGGSALLAWIMPTFNGAPHGCLNQPDLQEREDVLHFDSEAFAEGRNITGKIKVSLKVSSDAEDTAFSVKLMEVFPDGRSFNIVDGITSLSYRNDSDEPQDYTPNEPVVVTIDMWPTAWALEKGSKIRAEISSSNFPAYHVHSNLKGLWSALEDHIVAKQTIHLDDEASYIELPE